MAIQYTSAQTRSQMIAVGKDVPFWSDKPRQWEKVYLAGVEVPGHCTVNGEGLRLRKQSLALEGVDFEEITIIGLENTRFTIHCVMWLPEHLKQFRELIWKCTPNVRRTSRVVSQTSETSKVGYYTNQGIPTAWDMDTALAPETADILTKPALGYFAVALDEQQTSRDGWGNQPTGQSVLADRTTTNTVKARGDDQIGPVSIVYPSLKLFGITQCVVEGVSLPLEAGDGTWYAEIYCSEFGKPEYKGLKKPKAAKDATDIKPGSVPLLNGVQQTSDEVGVNPALANAGPNFGDR